MDKETDKMPEDESHFVDKVIGLTKQLYAEHGIVSPFAMMTVDPKISSKDFVMFMPSLAGDEATIMEAKARIIHTGYCLKTTMVAAVAESWIIKDDQDNDPVLKNILATDGDFSSHPNAEEQVTIIAESESGACLVTMDIDRKHPSMTIVETSSRHYVPFDSDQFELVHNGMYMRQEERKKPKNIKTIRAMSVVYGDPEEKLHEAELAEIQPYSVNNNNIN